MKKKIFLTLITIISLLLFTNKVDAVVMWMECDYGSECEKMNKCDSDYNIFVTLTKKTGGIYSEVQNSSKTKEFRNIVNDGCWINNFNDLTDKCDIGENSTGGAYETYTKLQSGVCPAGVRNRKGGARIVLVGTSKPKRISELTKSEYIIYNYYSDDEEKDVVIIEGYYHDGRFAYINNNVDELGDNNPNKFQKFSIYGEYNEPNNGDFWKVATNFNALYPYVQNLCESKDECEKEHNYYVITDSNDSTGRFRENVKKWYDEEGAKYKELQASFITVINNEKLVSTSKKIQEAIENKVDYEFSSSYSVEQMIKDLKNAFGTLSNAKNFNFTDYSTCNTENKNEKIDPLASAETYFWSEMFGLCRPDPEELIADDNNDLSLNVGLIRSMVATDIRKYVDELNSGEIDILELENTIKEYTKLFLTAITYIDSNAERLLNADQYKEVKDLKLEYEKYAETLNIAVVIDCEGLIGEELLNKINSYLNIIKIAIPIILIGFGIIDFTKAIFAGDESAMKKAQQQFIKRLGIAILIFLIPTFVNLILQLANKVWPIITPSTCGIFE